MPHLFRERQDVIGASIDVVYFGAVIATMLRWAASGESRYVCACNVHSVVTAQHDPRLAAALHAADMAVPDGAPVAWLMRKFGHATQQRVSGPDLMWLYFSAAAAYGESVYLLGGTVDTLTRLQARIAQAFPGLRIAGVSSPPYRQLTAEEDESLVATINASGATTVWVSLGCPKQEIWMAEHTGRIRAVLIGVGAAFGFHAGTVRRAPLWMQRLALEWLHRLLSEPRRLWRRYLTTNTLFVLAALRQLTR